MARLIRERRPSLRERERAGALMKFGRKIAWMESAWKSVEIFDAGGWKRTNIRQAKMTKKYSTVILRKNNFFAHCYFPQTRLVSSFPLCRRLRMHAYNLSLSLSLSLSLPPSPPLSDANHKFHTAYRREKAVFPILQVQSVPLPFMEHNTFLQQ